MASTILQVYAVLLAIWHSYRAYILVLALGAAIFISKLPNRRKQLVSETISTTKAEKPDTSIRPDHPRTASLTTAAPSKGETKAGPKRLRGTRPLKADAKESQITSIRPLVFFTSLTGSTEKKAHYVYERLKTKLELSPQDVQCKLLAPELHDLAYIDFDDYFVTAPKPPASEPGTSFVYCIILPSYDIDSIINNFLGHLDETHNDFRIDTSPLSGLTGYSVFGFGDKEGWPTPEEGFCSQAMAVDKWMAKLTGKRRAYPLGLGDVKSDAEHAVQEWCDGIVGVLHDISENGGGLGEGVPGSGDPIESDEEDAEDEEQTQSPSRPRRTIAKSSQVTDLEDIKFKPEDLLDDEPIDFTTYSNT
ncbi:hypothetical protein FQN49_008681, partial [Arthroderma sp. PD_2]